MLKAQQFSRFSPVVADRVAKLPDVDAVAAFRFRKFRVEGNEEVVAAVNERGLAATVDLRMVQGSISGLGPDGILVFEDAADEYHVKIGDRLPVQLTASLLLNLRVAGIYEQEDFTGGFPVPFVISRQAYERGFGPEQQVSLVYVKSTGTVDTVGPELDAALHRDFPNVDIFTRQGYRNDQERAIDRFLTVTIALLLLAEIIAVLGIVNTLALSVFERTRELGLLRAIGMSTQQVRQMIRGESVIVAIIGALIGAVIGVFWGWSFTYALKAQGITRFHVPGLQLAIFVIVAILAGVVAAWFPARRASKLDVLDAIATE